MNFILFYLEIKIYLEIMNIMKNLKDEFHLIMILYNTLISVIYICLPMRPNTLNKLDNVDHNKTRNLIE